MLRVGFDRQAFLLQEFGGISRYFSDLFFGLMDRDDISPLLLFRRHRNNYLLDRNTGTRMSKLEANLMIRFLEIANPVILLSEAVKIHHATFYLGTPKSRS